MTAGTFYSEVGSEEPRTSGHSLRFGRDAFSSTAVHSHAHAPVGRAPPGSSRQVLAAGCIGEKKGLDVGARGSSHPLLSGIGRVLPAPSTQGQTLRHTWPGGSRAADGGRFPSGGKGVKAIAVGDPRVLVAEDGVTDLHPEQRHSPEGPRYPCEGAGVQP